MARTPKQQEALYHHGDLARALVEAAELVLQERGVAGLSLREVARRAGVSHAAPAHHFGDKAGLLTAVAIEGFQRFHKALADAYRAAPDAKAGFAATGRAYVRFAVDNRAMFELMFRPEHYRADDERLSAASQPSYQVLVDAIVDCQKLGHLAGADPRQVALSSWCKVHGFATLWIDGNLEGRVGMSLEETMDVAFSEVPTG